MIQGKGRRKGIYNRRSPNCFEEDFITKCKEEPTEAWQRRCNVGTVFHNIARYKTPTQTTSLLGEFATPKHPSPESKTERIYIFDIDY